MNYVVVKVFPGKRMDIRIVRMNAGGHYRIQYQYSKRRDKFLNYIGSDFRKGSLAEQVDGRFYELEDALPYAKRALRRNNP